MPEKETKNKSGQDASRQERHTSKMTNLLQKVGKVRLLIIVVAIVAVLAGLLLFVIIHGIGNSGQSTTVSIPQATTSGKVNQFSKKQWVAVTLSTGDVCYGHLKSSDTLGAYVLWNVWRPASVPTSADETPTISFSKVGTELHKPMPYMVISPSALVSWQEVGSDSAAIKEITGIAGYKEAAEPTDKDILSASLSAVFLEDNSVYFGTLVRDKGQTGIKDGYVMARKNPSADPSAPISSLNDLQLIPQQNQAPGADGTLWLGQNSLVMYETLSPDSPVVKALGTKK